MKIQELFDLLTASEDFLSFWEGVETVDQMISRLEHLKRADPEGLLEDMQSLKMSTSAAFTANIELGGALTQHGIDSAEDGDLERALAGFEDGEEVPDGGTTPTENATEDSETVTEKTPT
jgi:hypothetical protein